MIEDILQTLIASIDKNTAALTQLHGGPASPAGATPPADPKKTPAKPKAEAPVKPAEPPKPVGPTLEDFQACAKEILAPEVNRSDLIEGIVKKHGLTKLRDAIGTVKAEAVHADLKAAVLEAKKPKAASADTLV